MRLDEFKEEIRNISRNYIVGNTSGGSTTIVQVNDNVTHMIALVSNTTQLSFSTDFNAFRGKDLEERALLFNAIAMLSTTPIKDRKELKKYYYRTVDEDFYDGRNYLNLVNDESVTITCKDQVAECVTQFTEQEFKDIAYKYKLDIHSFVRTDIPEE